VSKRALPVSGRFSEQLPKNPPLLFADPARLGDPACTAGTFLLHHPSSTVDLISVSFKE